MKVFIQDVVNNDGKIIINCTSQFGQYKVEWNGEIPLINHWYSIELEIEEVLKWGQNIKCYKDKDYTIQGDNKNLVIIGKLESIDEDGYTVLRVKEEMITFMAKGLPYKIDSTVQVMSGSVIAFPINY